LSARKFLDSLDNQAVKAATLLCLTELYQSLGPLSVPLLPPFIAWMLELMSDTSIVKVNLKFVMTGVRLLDKPCNNFITVKKQNLSDWWEIWLNDQVVCGTVGVW